MNVRPSIVGSAPRAPKAGAQREDAGAELRQQRRPRRARRRNYAHAAPGAQLRPQAGAQFGKSGRGHHAYARSHESHRRPTEAGRIDGVSSQCRAVEASPSSRAHSMCADANRQSLTVLRLRDRPSAMHCCMAMLRRRRWLMRHLVVTMLRLRSRSRRLRNS